MLRRLFAAWFLFLFACAAGTWAPAQEDDEWYARYREANRAGRYADAERYIRLSIELKKKSNPALAIPRMRALAIVLKQRDKFEEAGRVIAEALELCRRHRGEDTVYGSLLGDRGTLASEVGNYAEGERDLIASIRLLSTLVSPSDYRILAPTVMLAQTYQMQGRYADAEQLLVPRLRYFDADDQATWLQRGLALYVLGEIARAQGRFDRCESYFRESLLLCLRRTGESSGATAEALANLGAVLSQQGRHPEAYPLFHRALEIQLRVYGPQNTSVACTRVNLGLCCARLRKCDAALEETQMALATFRNAFQGDHAMTANCLLNLGVVYGYMRRLPEAEAVYRECLAMEERNRGVEGPHIARIIMRLSQVLRDTGKYDEAITLLARGAAIHQKFGLDPSLAAVSNMIQSQAQWAQGKQDEALITLERALQLADQQRNMSAGSEVERATLTGTFSEMFEQMVAWQVERGDIDQSLRAMERWRARSFLEEMSVSNADLFAGYSAAQRTTVIQRETKLREQIAGLESQLSRISRGQPIDDKTTAARDKLIDQIAAHKNGLYQHWRETRSASPVYRNLISSQQEFAGIDHLREFVETERGMALEYFIGATKSYLIAVTKDQATVCTLTLDAEQAATLGVEPGELNRDKLQQILVHPAETSLIRQLSTPKEDATLTTRLHALWTVLIPKAQRTALMFGHISRLIVLPDTPLTFLPFEALVVETGPDVKYLLDVGPPILYGPSTTVLSNLAKRTAKPGNGAEVVLTVGDADYGAAASAEREAKLPLPNSRTRLNLSRLPYSGLESNWVFEVFGKQQLAVARLTKGQATEANVRRAISGKRIVHLACHGMSDDAYGNFFGALAFATGNASNPDNDGTLQLSEIYSLDLSSCELAILSACVTNHGPGQQGEGVWALSRGFLVAGARRAVASNWVVDDEAGASLISYFCAGIAQRSKVGQSLDYAACLQDAKKFVRGESNWKHPYYWSTFELMGPP